MTQAVNDQILSLAASKLTGTVALANGGTAANLSATGGTGQVLKQSSAGAAVTVGVLAGSDITGAALTRVDDTNVTLTLTGSPTVALLAATGLTLGWTGTLSAARGGTGTGAYAVGDVLYADTTTTLSRRAAVAVGSVLISNGVGVAPTWSVAPQITRIGIGDVPIVGTAMNVFGQIVITGSDATTNVTLASFAAVSNYNAGSEKLGLLGSLFGNAASTNPTFVGLQGQVLSSSGAFSSLRYAGVRGKVLYQATSGTLTDAVGLQSNINSTGGATVTNAYGVLIETPVLSGGGSIGTSYGLYLTSQNVGTTTWAIYQSGTSDRNFFGGTIGVGITPTALLHLKAGSATASTAPLKFTSGPLNTTAEAGALEFLTDDYFATITTGAARKAFVLDNGARLTSGNVPIATTNGRLIDGPALVGGIWSVPSGGTGVGTLASNGVLYGNGTGAVQALAVNAGAKLFLTQTSSAAPAWAAIVAGDVPTLNQNTTGTSATVTGATQSAITTAANLTTVGALNAGSITSGFGAIDVGADAITGGVGTFSLTGTGTVIFAKATGEAQVSIWSDTGSASADTDAFLRFLIDGGTLKGLMGYDQGLDRFVLGYNGTSGIRIDSSGNFEIPINLSKYKGVSTAGWGVPAIYGSGRSVAQVAAVASVAAYTLTAADASFLIVANVNVTTSTLHNFTVTVGYTDEGNTARTLTLTFSQLTGALVTAITNVTGAGPYEGIAMQIRCKASTAITVATVGTFTTLVYNVEAVIQQVS